VTVEVRCEAARGRTVARALEADATALLRLCGLADGELSLMIVGDRAMRSLNRHFRGKDEPTDVLSFSQLEEVGRANRRARLRSKRPGAADAAPGRLLGDVVISIDTARRQARELSVPIAERLRTLLIHGYLHLLGYDHERSAAAARAMFARERELAALLKPASGAPAARTQARQRSAGAAGGSAASGRRRARAETRR